MTSTKTLVKYNNPFAISTTTKSSMMGKSTSRTEDLLNSMLKPRKWMKDDKIWVQTVSSTPATRVDLKKLESTLDTMLREKKAKAYGICSVRHDLYSQCLDEIIRQVTIGCAEKGLLLLRLRDEIRMTHSTYRSLYESSIAYGMRKAILTKACEKEMNSTISNLEHEIEELAIQKAKLEEKFAPEEEYSNLKHEEEVSKLKNSNQKLMQMLEEKLGYPTEKDTGTGLLA